jgi:hypothetical protein
MYKQPTNIVFSQTPGNVTAELTSQSSVEQHAPLLLEAHEFGYCCH